MQIVQIAWALSQGHGTGTAGPRGRHCASKILKVVVWSPKYWNASGRTGRGL